MERKRKKQEERLRRLEEKKKLNGGKVSNADCASRVSSLSDIDGNNSESEIDVVGEESTGTGNAQENEVDLSTPPHASQEKRNDNMADGQNGLRPALLRSAFSIDSLLETPKVPRGRRPNSKYPRVQASKSMNPLSLGMYPLYPITQPVGFQVERPPTPARSCSPSDPSPEPLRRFSSPSSLKTTKHPQHQSYSNAALDCRSEKPAEPNDNHDQRKPQRKLYSASDTDDETDQECVSFAPRRPNGLVIGPNGGVLILPGSRHQRKCVTPPYVKCVNKDKEVKRSSSNPNFSVYPELERPCDEAFALDCSMKGRSAQPV